MNVDEIKLKHFKEIIGNERWLSVSMIISFFTLWSLSVSQILNRGQIDTNRKIPKLSYCLWNRALLCSHDPHFVAVKFQFAYHRKISDVKWIQFDWKSTLTFTPFERFWKLHGKTENNSTEFPHYPFELSMETFR